MTKTAAVKTMPDLLQRATRPLSLLMLGSALLLVFKVTDIADDVVSFAPSAIAAEDEPEAAGQAVADAKPQDAPAPDAVLVEAPQADFANDPAMMSQSELSLLRDLSSRRTKLEGREKELDMRARLLEATEKRIESKIADLKALEGQVKSLLTSYESQENEQLSSIVKVYEKMKPKDAARILEKLDMSIQLDVAQRMSELRMAPIMAAMSAEGARNLTTQLAARPKLNLAQDVNQ